MASIHTAARQTKELGFPSERVMEKMELRLGCWSLDIRGREDTDLHPAASGYLPGTHTHTHTSSFTMKQEDSSRLRALMSHLPHLPHLH